VPARDFEIDCGAPVPVQGTIEFRLEARAKADERKGLKAVLILLSFLTVAAWFIVIISLYILYELVKS